MRVTVTVSVTLTLVLSRPDEGDGARAFIQSPGSRAALERLPMATGRIGYS